MPVRLMPTRHSPFYTPFLALHSAGFLRQEGVESMLRLPAEGESTGAVLQRGEVDVVQSAISAAWTQFDKGNADTPLHFAQINQRDGFFLVGREPAGDFTWKSLEGKTLLADHGHQPLVMLRWAAHNKGADFSRIQVVNRGSATAMEKAFRGGEGDYIHLQGGVPHQIVQDRAGHIVAAVGEGLPVLAFSSIAAPREWVGGELREPFLRAFVKAREWAQNEHPEEISKVVAPLFADLSQPAVTAAITDIQEIGCWGGSPLILPEAYLEAERVFLWANGIQRAHPYKKSVYIAP